MLPAARAKNRNQPMDWVGEGERPSSPHGALIRYLQREGFSAGTEKGSRVCGVLILKAFTRLGIQ